MANRYEFFISVILDCLDLDIPLYPLESVYDFAKRKKLNDFNRKKYTQTIWNMKKRGYLKVVEKNNQKFLQITQKGQLQQLLIKAAVVKQEKWDGKWRILIFDIPEEFHEKRDHFRWLLRQNSFVKLQASVFVSPFPLNREALGYLKETGLNNYIRIMKVEEMDDDKDLLKRFGLIHSRP